MMNKLNKPFTAQEMGGRTSRYIFYQTDEEIELFVFVPRATARADVTVSIRPNSLTVALKNVPGGPIIDNGKFYRLVDHRECHWQLDELPDQQTLEPGNYDTANCVGGRGDQKCVWIILKKKERTQRSGHWKCVCVGDDEIDVKKFGPQLVEVGEDGQERGGRER